MSGRRRAVVPRPQERGMLAPNAPFTCMSVLGRYVAWGDLAGGGNYPQNAFTPSKILDQEPGT